MKRTTNTVAEDIEAALATRERARQLRLDRKLTQMELAVRSGVGLPTIFRVEKTGRLTRRVAERLAPVLGVPVKRLLGP